MSTFDPVSGYPPVSASASSGASVAGSLKHCLQIYCIRHDFYINRHKKFFD